VADLNAVFFALSYPPTNFFLIPDLNSNFEVKPAPFLIIQ
jgi:hypothetical protein